MVLKYRKVVNGSVIVSVVIAAAAAAAIFAFAVVVIADIKGIEYAAIFQLKVIVIQEIHFAIIHKDMFDIHITSIKLDYPIGGVSGYHRQLSVTLNAAMGQVNINGNLLVRHFERLVVMVY